MAKIGDDDLFADESPKGGSRPKPSKEGAEKGDKIRGVAAVVVVAWFIVGFIAGYAYKTFSIMGLEETEKKVVIPPPLTEEQIMSGEQPAGHPEIEGAEKP
ncbi:MAG: hypothetical protein QMD53_06520 [Actinomycetota bacterium]|nr:hypothetical protein [Actinomycetota bacterium]